MGFKSYLTILYQIPTNIFNPPKLLINIPKTLPHKPRNKRLEYLLILYNRIDKKFNLSFPLQPRYFTPLPKISSTFGHTLEKLSISYIRTRINRLMSVGIYYFGLVYNREWKWSCQSTYHWLSYLFINYEYDAVLWHRFFSKYIINPKSPASSPLLPLPFPFPQLTKLHKTPQAYSPSSASAKSS